MGTKLVNLEFTLFNVTIAEAEQNAFLDQLEKVCEKYAGDSWALSWKCEMVDLNL